MIRSLFNLNKVLHIKNNFCNFKRTASTIYALSSGKGKCGVAVIRISGNSSETVLKKLTGLLQVPKPRYAMLRSLRHPITKEVLDKGLILWFPGPDSFTGEDCCELHVHGGIAVVTGILDALSALPNLRLAEAGEFTKRSFYNGKLDLIEVEGLADLLQSETEIQRKQAFYQSQGALSKLYNKWRDTLTKSVAHIEAHIDFDESESIVNNLLNDITNNIWKLSEEIQQHLNDGRKGEILRNGVRTVILGEPNVGKSSVLNLLCQRPAAIVTPIEGTTRDVLEVTLNINGYPLILFDTAGLRGKTVDIIEEEGINRAKTIYQIADLILLVVDAVNYINSNNKNFFSYLKSYIKKLNLNDLINDDSQDIRTLFKKNCLVVLNKIDLIQIPQSIGILGSNEIVSCISCKYETGTKNLVTTVTKKLEFLCGNPSSEQPSMNQQRHKQHLIDCLKNLNLFLKYTSDNSLDIVLMAEYLRKSLRHLGKLVGVITTEQLLDIIFKDFCIGK